jgi:GTP-binding protein EngB required for normal cell division
MYVAANGFYSRLNAVVGAFFMPTCLLRVKHGIGNNCVEHIVSGTGKNEASLRLYTLAKQEVAASVRAAKQFFQAHRAEAKAQEASERCQELLVQLAEDRFNLAVVGQFKRGKSTLMNAILGRDLLPTGLLPLTSAITTLCYGSTERVILRRKGWTLEQEIPLAQLADYITERGNPGNEKRLVEARVELPLSFLRRGLHFIDTPGIGSARQENTATTYAFLPQMAAVIFVTSVEAPLSEAEERFLIDIREQVRQLFIVVNKLDMLATQEREDLLGYIRIHVERLLGTGDVQLSPLSARDGLIARLNHDDANFHRSGLAFFEQALTSFLAEAQGRTFLVSILDRALRLFAETDPTLVQAPTGEESGRRGSVLDLQRTMESLRASLLAGAPLSAMRNPAESITTDPHIIDQAIVESLSPTQKSNGRQANLRTRTCPICVALEQALFSFFARWQYTLATNASAQRAFAAERGLCPIHTWQYQDMASPQGISDGYAPLIESLAVELSRLTGLSAAHASAPLAALLASSTTCAVCRLVRETAAERVVQLLAQLTTVSGREDYTFSAGLCLPHLQEALAYMEYIDDKTGEYSVIAEFLLREQVRRLENLAEDLHSYALKRDALRRGLLHQEEANAWRRALVQLVGERAARGGAMMADQGTV